MPSWLRESGLLGEVCRGDQTRHQLLLAASITFMNEIARICDVDGIVVCTEWPQLLEVEWEKTLTQASGRVVIDANAFIEQRVRGIPGLVYRSVGRPRNL
jgi:hypothetical protein